MSKIRLTINGRSVSAAEGQTILEVCRQYDVHVPTLCHLDGLTDIGACRLCIVEVENQRRPVPACTTPAEEGMVVLTSTPALENLRRQTLELLFGERNHICPFCPASSNCELQTAGYAHRIDHVRYNYLYPTLPVDNSHRYIALDHNRCILCSRCIRACDEWIGAHVLDLDNRGSKTVLVADDGVPLGQSTCVSCGTCVSVCPTGALFEKRSAHWQGRLPLEMTETICPGCGVGCRINASVRHRQIGALESSGGPGGNHVLCERGRFGLVNPTAPRVEAIRMKRGNTWQTRTLEDVLGECARRLSAAPVQAEPDRVIGLLSPRLPLETIAAARSFIIRAAGSTRWSIVDRSNTPAIKEAFKVNGQLAPLAGLRDLEDADMFLLLGCNLERSHGVVASYVRRGVLHRRARLVKLNPRHTWLTDWTDLQISAERGRDALALSAILKYLIDEGKTRVSVPEDLAKKLQKLDDAAIGAATGIAPEKLRQVARLYGEAERPMILCSLGITRQPPAAMQAAFNLVRATNRKTASGRWRIMELAIGANSRGARVLGESTTSIETLDPHSADVAFVVLGDDDQVWQQRWLDKLRTIPFVVAMAAREHPVNEIAHVVIPTAAWAERSGTYVNLEGRVQKGISLMDPLPQCVDETAFFQRLAKAWHGDGCAWAPDGLPDEIAPLADGHMVPCGPALNEMDWSGLTQLASE